MRPCTPGLSFSLAFALAMGCLTGCDSEKKRPRVSVVKSAQDAHPKLVERSAMFKKEVQNPAPGVYVAVGYGMANSILVEGDDAAFIVDTMESRSAAEEVLTAFRAQVTDKPIEALVLTHNHADHVFGGQVFTEGRDIPVYAHVSTQAQIDRVVNILGPTIQVRSQRMFGTYLDEASLINCGIGPRLRFAMDDMTLARPNKTFHERMAVTLAGVEAELVHSPGETDDQIYVWLPEHKVLMPGDNIYEAFPNLYTIRGTPYRDVLKWQASLEAMMELGAEVLVPSHGHPLVGKDKIHDTLLAYRDAIQYVHDQTVRGINNGLSPDQLAATIELPPHLKDHPWLVELYGRVPWSVRAIYSGYLGWFDGHLANLEPPPPEARAKKLVAAMSAGLPISRQTADALSAEDWPWATELAEVWVQAEPDSDDARDALAQAAVGLAKGHPNPSARHWYLTRAAELTGRLTIEPTDPDQTPRDFIDKLPIEAFFKSLTVRLKAEDALDADMKTDFVFADDPRIFRIHIRRGVAALSIDPRGPADLTIQTSVKVWRRVLTRHQSPLDAVMTSQVEVEGGVTPLLKFLAFFQR